MKNIYQLAKDHKSVDSALGYIINNNKSNNAPYHNFYHLCCVAEAAYHMAEMYCDKSEDRESLVIAGLFHDFDHSMGRFPDNVNIKMALDGYDLWRTSYDGELDDFTIKNCIKVTQYPYVIPNAQLQTDIVSLIIRDADMVQCMMPNWTQQALFGLGQEFGKDIFDSIDGQVKFLLAVEFNTSWMKEKWSENREQIMSILKKMQEYR